MPDLQRVASNQEAGTKLPYGFSLLDEAYRAIQRQVNNWPGYEKLEASPNWHFIPSFFVDQGFHSRPKGEWYSKSKALMENDSRLQKIARKEDWDARQGICTFFLQIFVQKHIDNLRVWRPHHAADERISTPSTTFKNAIAENIKEITEFSDAGPATFTQSYARQILLDLRSPNSMLFPNGMDDIIIPKFLIPNMDDTHFELDGLSGLAVSKSRGRTNALANECARAVKNKIAQQPYRTSLARHLGTRENTTCFRRVWKKFIDSVPKEQKDEFTRPGRRPTREKVK